MALDVETYVSLGLHSDPVLEVNGHAPADFAAYLNHAGDAHYHPCPEAFPGPDVPRGTITRHKDWASVGVYPGTVRVKLGR